MTKEQIIDFEEKLEDNGYRKITTCKVKQRDDFEYYKSFNDKKGNHLYQIFFEFWDFTKFGDFNKGGWGLSVSILPESCEDNVGRRDLALSTDWVDDIKRVEYTAERFYKFIRKIDKYEVTFK